MQADKVEKTTNYLDLLDVGVETKKMIYIWVRFAHLNDAQGNLIKVIKLVDQELEQ